MKTPLRWVLDTNVVLSALLFRSGMAHRLMTHWVSGRIQPLICTATASELIRALAYPKFRLDAQDQQELLAEYLPYCEVVVLGRPPVGLPACRDPQDQPFVHLSVQGRAKALVTGDRDLLALRRQLKCEALTPAQALERL